MEAIISTVGIVIAIFIAFKFMPRLLDTASNMLDVVDSVVDAGKVHTEAYKNDAKSQAKINSLKKKAKIKKELDKLNSERKVSGKSELKNDIIDLDDDV